MKSAPGSWQIQGRRVTEADLEWIRAYREEHPQARRKRIAVALCRHWGWRNGRGDLKEIAARSLLNKLAERGVVELPPLRSWVRRNASMGRGAAEAPEPGERIEGKLRDLQPLRVQPVEEGDGAQRRWAGYLRYHHYLGLRVVGENLGYLIGDRAGRDLAVLLFGAAAWRCSARDRYVGWSDTERAEGLQGIANNTRFLILPWVQVPHLASHVLGLIGGRIDEDWRRKYGHGLCWLETFVDRERFAGTCYRAANWVEVGSTQGRTRQDREGRIRVSRKYVLLYALNRRGRRGA